MQTNGYPNELFKYYRLESEARAEWRRHIDNVSRIQTTTPNSVDSSEINNNDGVQPTRPGKEMHLPSLLLGIVARILLFCVLNNFL